MPLCEPQIIFKSAGPSGIECLMKKFFRHITLATFAIAGLDAQAAKKDEARVQSLESFLDSQAAITGQRYISSTRLKDKEVRIPADFPLTKNGSEIFLTNFLVGNGLMRVPTGEANVFYIEELRNAAQAPIPSFDASVSQAPALPDTFDVVTLNYKAIDRERCRFIQRFIVSMVPRFGRADCFEDTGNILVIDTARNLKRIYDLVKSFDVKPLPEKPAAPKASAPKAKLSKKAPAPAKAAPSAPPMETPVIPPPPKPEAGAGRERPSESASAFSPSGALMEAAFDNEPVAEAEMPVEALDGKDAKSELSSSSSTDGSSSSSPDSSTSTSPKYPGG